MPVYNFTGEVIGALGISGPIWRMTDQVIQSRAKLVRTGREPAVRRVRRPGSCEILLIFSDPAS